MSTDPSTAMRWRVDPADATAEFRVPHFWGLVTVTGHFDRIDGWLETDVNGPRRLELILDAGSLNTGNRRRDTHLRSPDFFHAEQHPEVRFRSTKVSDAGNGRLHVEGELLGAGKQVELTLEPTLTQTDDQIEIDASATVNQRDLGMTWSPLGVTRTPSTLAVHARLKPQR